MTQRSPREIATVLVAVLATWIGLSLGRVAAGAAPEPQPAPGKMLQTFLDGPMAGTNELVFAARPSGTDPHWYANFAYWSSEPDRKMYAEGGRLCRLNLRTGELRLLVDDPAGGVRDPCVHYDGKRILFSYRKGGEACYHLYEINADGSGLVQLTDGPDDDIEPIYLPDGGILFCSSRCRRFVNCWHTRVANLYRSDADGKNIRVVSSNNDHDNTPWVLADGRVLYMRWEYVDRSQVHFHHLWTVNPDGTGQMTWFGNEYAGIVMLDAKPIPGTSKAVVSFSPGHGRVEHLGAVTVVDPARGPDMMSAAKRISKDDNYRDPYAFSEDCFLVANPSGIFVMDGAGRIELVYRLPAADRRLECHEPRPLAPHPREPVLHSRIDPAQDSGRLVLEDIYAGRNMAGVRRGEIKKLLVLEQLPEPVHFSGGMEPLTLGGTFTMARILGTVPVEPDGSAYMELPALRSMFLVALDENDLSVKRMQSFVTLQPGEKTGCVGCHEQRSRAPHFKAELMATKRSPSRLVAIEDAPEVFDFSRDIQPLLDKHCVACHSAEKYEGRVDLTSDRTAWYTQSYLAITRLGLVADGRNQPYGNRPPRSIGSSASRLMKLIDGSHYGAAFSAHERKLVRLWIETGATYPGTYAALGCGMYDVAVPLAAIQKRCLGCHGAVPPAPERTLVAAKFTDMPYPTQTLFNLTRPEKSLILRAPLAKEAGGLGLCGEKVFADPSDAQYREILAAVLAAAERLKSEKRFDMPGFRPNEHYIRELQRFGILPRDLSPEQPIDFYAADRAYWRSFWYRPPAEP
ncbi:MAG: HzsA-related protein [Pirellulales bacterium]